MLTHIHHSEFGNRERDTLEQISVSVDYLIKYQNNHGYGQLLSLIKRSRQMVLTYLADPSRKACPYEGTWIKTDKRGIPCWLGRFKEGESLADPKLVKYTLTLLFLSRWLSFDGKADYTIIENTEKAELNHDFVSFLRSKENPYANLPKKFRVGRILFHSSTKAGPNGPAMMNSLLDIFPMEQGYRETLVKIIDIIDQSSPLKVPLTDDELINSRLSSGKLVPRKICPINDKEGKVRLIAIPDYWTQAVMKPIHQGINTLLKSLYTDCTYNQNHFKDALDPYFNGQTFYSIDLKSATELMPSNWQAEVLKWVSESTELGDLWLSLMTEYPWSREDDSPLYFKRGQPMGVYASWPLMALTHHLIYRWSLIKCGILELTEPYFLLGDDMLIIGDKNFKAYQWGIEQTKMILNKEKTFSSKNFFEFAKRFFLKGVEVSPFPIGALLSSNGSPSVMSVAIDNAFTKSWLLNLITDEATRKRLFLDLILVLDPSAPWRRARELEKVIGLTSILRWVIRPETQTPLLGNLFSSLSCNMKKASRIEFLQYYLTFFLQKEAKDHLTESLRSCWIIQDHLFSSPLKRNPKLIGYHPAGGLILSNRREISDLQQDLLSSFEGGPGVNLQNLLDAAIRPVPTHKALYRANDKGSTRRAQILGHLARDLDKVFVGVVPKSLQLWYDEVSVARQGTV